MLTKKFKKLSLRLIKVKLTIIVQILILKKDNETIIQNESIIYFTSIMNSFVISMLINIIFNIYIINKNWVIVVLFSFFLRFFFIFFKKYINNL